MCVCTLQELNDVCLGHLFTYRDFKGAYCIVIIVHIILHIIFFVQEQLGWHMWVIPVSWICV